MKNIKEKDMSVIELMVMMECYRKLMDVLDWMWKSKNKKYTWEHKERRIKKSTTSNSSKLMSHPKNFKHTYQIYVEWNTLILTK